MFEKLASIILNSSNKEMCLKVDFINNEYIPIDLERDDVIHIDDGRWGPIEIKLGSVESIDVAAEKLKKLITKLDESYPKPAFMGIVVANGIAYKRPDGIYVIPLNLLKD